MHFDSVADSFLYRFENIETPIWNKNFYGPVTSNFTDPLSHRVLRETESTFTRKYPFTRSLAQVSCVTTSANTAESLSLDITKLFTTISVFSETWRRFTTTILAFWTRDTLQKIPKQIKREWSMGARGYGISLRASNSISNSFSALTCETSHWTEKRNFISKSNHIFFYYIETMGLYRPENNFDFLINDRVARKTSDVSAAD